MQLKPILVMIVGLALAGGSFVVTQGFVGAPTVAANAAIPEKAEQPQVVRAIIAGRDIKFGEALTLENLTHQEWPIGSVPEGTFSKYADVLGQDTTRPRSAKREISQGELILVDKISNFGESVTLVQTLSKNTRAVSIEVNAVTSVGGFVTPGDRVDVVLTQGRGETLRAATILQDIRVLGIDQDAVRTGKRAKVAQTITVEVTPQQGQKLALARRAGVISLTLRTLNAEQSEPLKQITLADLLGEAAPIVEAEPVVPATVVEAPAPVEKRTVKVRRGKEEEIVEFEF
ncbi:Flp pilus assembly protein CpaB [uncultured Litoreibacter sp.]|uniref:Flp pilus assembly protein CpaB n=1 Tax=uncultured Litoreibacter sp. TaxID=1392394 RepID=UPI002615DF21|nr:Flp pilus assembly protein CpaB [uncultured Litoreibacter sp.]